jgi:hypothetical protein
VARRRRELVLDGATGTGHHGHGAPIPARGASATGRLSQARGHPHRQGDPTAAAQGLRHSGDHRRRHHLGRRQRRLGSHPYKVDQISVAHNGSRTTAYVSFRIHNLGGSSFQPSCSVSIVAVYGSRIGAGEASPVSPIDGQQYGSVETAITVTANDAMAIDASDVRCRAHPDRHQRHRRDPELPRRAPLRMALTTRSHGSSQRNDAREPLGRLASPALRCAQY